MTRKRTIGTRAALGGLTAAVALIAAQPAAQGRRSERSAGQSGGSPAAYRPVGAGRQCRATRTASATTGGPGQRADDGGSFPRSFLIPGTDTSIRVGGEIRDDARCTCSTAATRTRRRTSTNAGATGQPTPSRCNSDPVGRRRTTASAHNCLNMSPQQSKLSVETRTPTAWGEARTFIEFDCAGATTRAASTNPMSRSRTTCMPRLRYAYGTLGPLLFGQANSNFTDPDASVESLDFGGLIGDPGRRASRRSAGRSRWAAGVCWVPCRSSAETPESEVWLPGAGDIRLRQRRTGPQTAGGQRAGLAAEPWCRTRFNP